MRKQSWIRLLAVIGALGGIWVGASPRPAAEEFAVEKVRDDLHVIVGGGGNVGVLQTGEGVILVDDKFDRHVPDILAKVRTLTDEPVRYVLNTHHHGDHSGGNPTLQKTAQIIAHRNARKNMVEKAQPGAPRLTFREEASLFLGKKEVQARYYGSGHTDGDAVIYFPAHRVVHMGDLFVQGSPYIDYSAGGTAKEWDQILSKVLELDFDTVIPGHGPVSNREDLIRWKSNFETLRSRVQELRRQGKRPEQAAQLLDFKGLSGWSMNARLKNSFPGLYEELAP